MILVDTCVWIDYLKNRHTEKANFLIQIQRSLSEEICISGIIYFEILRGITDIKIRTRIAHYLDLLTRFDFKHTSYKEMLHQDLKCRRNGVTLHNIGDWLIVQTALDHNLKLLTSDTDFQLILPYVPLKLVKV